MNRSTKLAVFLVLILCGLLLAYYYWNPPGASANRLRLLSTWGLADFLAKAYPGTSALVLSNPFAMRKDAAPGVVDQERSGIEGLKIGFGTRLTLAKVAHPKLTPEAAANPRAVDIPPDATTPLSYLVAKDAFDQLVRDNPDCALVVSLIGLPAKLDEVESWTRSGDPKYALLLPDLRIMGSANAVLEAVRRDKLVAFVLDKPGSSVTTKRIGSDLKGEFDKRFLLVTKQNIEELRWKYPEAFGIRGDEK